MTQLGSHWTDFHDIRYFEHFSKKSVEEIQVSFKHDENDKYFTRSPMYFYDNTLLDRS